MFKWPGSNEPEEHANEVDLEEVMHLLSEASLEHETQPPDVALLCAQFADQLRDAKIKPLASEKAIQQLNAIQPGSQFRLTIMLATLSEPSLQHAFAKTMQSTDKPLHTVIQWCDSQHNLSAELINQSGLRLEEMARQIIHFYQASIADESEKASAERLQRLDYNQLLAQAEMAKASAEEQMAYLQKLKEEQEQLLGRRGKW